MKGKLHAYCISASEATPNTRPFSSPRLRRSIVSATVSTLATLSRGFLPSSASRPPQQCAEKLPELLLGIPSPLSSPGYAEGGRKRSWRGWEEEMPQVGRDPPSPPRRPRTRHRKSRSRSSAPPPFIPRSAPAPSPTLSWKTVKVKLIRGIYRGTVRKRCAVFLSESLIDRWFLSLAKLISLPIAWGGD